MGCLSLIHSVALRFQDDLDGGSQETRATPPEKGPVAPVFSALNQNCLQWGRSNLVDPAGSPKIRLLNRDLGTFCRFFPGKTAKHKVH